MLDLCRLAPVLLLAGLVTTGAAWAEEERGIPPAPPRAEGEGPWKRLILRGATLVDGTGAPPVGPVDIVVEGNRIQSIRSVGAPGVPIDETKRPKLEAGDHEIDLAGHYVLPGFVDLHGHLGGREQGTPAEYVLKLWMAHGITTSSDPGSGNGLEFMVEHKKKSELNQITAPRLKPYVFYGQGVKEPITRPEGARAFVQDVARRGAEGIKFFGLRPDLMAASIDEAKKLGLRTTCHHAQLAVARLNVLDTARMGLTSMQHWYGLPEALFTDKTVQDYPRDYNYNDEQDRFSQAGRLWRQAAAPGSPRWNAVLEELLKLDFTLSPTFHAYETTRDFMRMSRAEWHEQYTIPSLWRFYAPSRVNHGSYFHYWTTEDEVAWRDNYRLWMAFVNDFKNRGGRVGVGTDSGYTFNLYGFSFVREMELLREAGFHPLEVIRSATLAGAQALGVADSVGSVEPGKLADMVVVAENPVANLKVLYGTGALKLDEKNELVRVGGVRYTIKDGIVYDAKKLLADVRRMVRETKDKEGFEIRPLGR
jgi:cytosine/adenosine deaminase-related metal-dependent hydrolase